MHVTCSLFFHHRKNLQSLGNKHGKLPGTITKTFSLQLHFLWSSNINVRVYVFRICICTFLIHKNAFWNLLLLFFFCLIFSPTRASLLEHEDRSGQLGFVTGVIARERVPGFERLLWRACRGNVFLRRVPIENPIIDPTTGEEIHKEVFIVFYQGEQLGNRVKKICEGYVRIFVVVLSCVLLFSLFQSWNWSNISIVIALWFTEEYLILFALKTFRYEATIYPCPSNHSSRRELREGVNTRILDLQNVSSCLYQSLFSL